MVVASSCSDRCGSVAAVLLYKVQFSSKGPVMMWKGLVFLWNPVGKGCSDVPNLRFYLGRKCLAPPPGWSISQWDDGILSVMQWDSVAINRRYLLEGGWVVEKIKSTAPPGLTDGDRIQTFGPILLCKPNIVTGVSDKHLCQVLFYPCFPAFPA